MLLAVIERCDAPNNPRLHAYIDMNLGLNQSGGVFRKVKGVHQSIRALGDNEREVCGQCAKKYDVHGEIHVVVRHDGRSYTLKYNNKREREGGQGQEEREWDDRNRQERGGSNKRRN